MLWNLTWHTQVWKLWLPTSEVLEEEVLRHTGMSSRATSEDIKEGINHSLREGRRKDFVQGQRRASW